MLDINLADRYSNDEFEDTDSYSDIENVTGGAGDDTITGDAGDNVLKGGPGDDTIRGGGGDDTIDGGTEQTASGVLDGGEAAEDTLVVSDGTGTVTINTSPAVNFENLTDGTEAGGLDLIREIVATMCLPVGVATMCLPALKVMTILMVGREMTP